MRKQKTIEQLEREAKRRYENKQKSADDLKAHLSEHSSMVETVQDKFEDMLYRRGIFESDARKIMEFVKPLINELDTKDGQETDWSRPVTDYPEGFYFAMFLVMRPMVVTWAKTYKPKALWLSMFEQNTEEQS